jgi:hypothetical protein
MKGLVAQAFQPVQLPLSEKNNRGFAGRVNDHVAAGFTGCCPNRLGALFLQFSKAVIILH